MLNKSISPALLEITSDRDKNIRILSIQEFNRETALTSYTPDTLILASIKNGAYPGHINEATLCTPDDPDATLVTLKSDGHIGVFKISNN